MTTKKTADRPASQEQWARMTEIGRKCMENEYERLVKAIRDGKSNQTPVARRPPARVVSK